MLIYCDAYQQSFTRSAWFTSWIWPQTFLQFWFLEMQPINCRLLCYNCTKTYWLSEMNKCASQLLLSHCFGQICFTTAASWCYLRLWCQDSEELLSAGVSDPLQEGVNNSQVSATDRGITQAARLMLLRKVTPAQKRAAGSLNSLVWQL